MYDPKIVPVTCPSCDRKIHVLIDADAPVGTTVSRTCPEGHKFRIRFAGVEYEILLGRLPE